MRTKTEIRDDGDLRKYRIELPNIVDDLELSVYAARLYVHVKRVAGAYGDCRRSTRKMAQKCCMSPASVVRAKQELIIAGLIEVERDEDGTVDRIVILDIWRRNLDSFEGCFPNKQVLTTETDRTTTETDRTTTETPSLERTKEKEPIEVKNMSPNGDVVKVFDYWRIVHGHPRSQLDPARTKMIQARLRQYSVDDLKLAIDGCRRSAFHQGLEAGHPQVHNSIELICRDAKHVDQFIGYAERGGSGQAERGGSGQANEGASSNRGSSQPTWVVPKPANTLDLSVGADDE